MKALISILVLFAGGFSFVQSAVAQASLKEGIYKSIAGDITPFRVVFDPRTGNMLVDVGDGVDSMVRIDATHFGYNFQYTLAADDLKDCAPTTASKTPCDKYFGKEAYDGKTGRFLLKGGDSVQLTSVATVNSYISFELKQSATITRNGAVLVKDSLVKIQNFVYAIHQTQKDAAQ